MILVDLALFILSLYVLVKSAGKAVIYSSKIAKLFHLSEFIVSFFIIAVISTFPETTVSIISAINGVPEFGLGTLLGSNVADLSLVFGIVALFSSSGINVKSRTLKNDLFYLLLLLAPIILGFDGEFSRIDGLMLILCGSIFFISLAIESKIFKKTFDGGKHKKWFLNLTLFILSIICLIAGGHYTVKYGVAFANNINIPPFLVALTIVAVGTCLPELFLSINAVKANHDEIALGDVLGTVITDATIIIGIIALIRPFKFDPMIVYVTGSLMFVAGTIVVTAIKRKRLISKRVGVYLIIFYIISLIIQFLVNRAF